MAQHVADGRKVDTVQQEQGPVEVAQVVELQWLQPGLAERPFEPEQDGGTEERASQVVGEDQVRYGLPPAWTSRKLALQLGLVLGPKRLDGGTSRFGASLIGP